MTLGALVAWPDVADLTAYMAKVGQTGATIPVDAGETIEAVCELAADRFGFDVADDIPKVVRRAVLMQTHRILRRKDSPEGVVGFGENVALRVSRFDPDIEALILTNRRWTIG